jgi:hypothetical protein
MEALVVVFALLVAATLSDVPTGAVVAVGASAAVACVVVAALLRHPWAYVAGSVLQVLVLLSGLVVPTMWFLGAVFGVLWALALHLGAKAERIRAERERDAGRRPTGAGGRVAGVDMDDLDGHAGVS